MPRQVTPRHLTTNHITSSHPARNFVTSKQATSHHHHGSTCILLRAPGSRVWLVFFLFCVWLRCVAWFLFSARRSAFLDSGNPILCHTGCCCCGGYDETSDLTRLTFHMDCQHPRDPSQPETKKNPTYSGTDVCGAAGWCMSLRNCIHVKGEPVTHCPQLLCSFWCVDSKLLRDRQSGKQR